MQRAYLHGFRSGPDSFKGRRLAARFAARGLSFDNPDLNRPDFARLTYTGALAAVDDWAVGSGSVGLVGSSMGGWVAAEWAARHPERVPRLLLLCPGFDLPARWPALMGPETITRWQAEGTWRTEDVHGVPVDLHWNFIVDAQTHTAVPEVPCPTVIVHGVRDKIVPIASSRSYAATRPHVMLIEVDDDHGLTRSVERIGDLALGLFG